MIRETKRCPKSNKTFVVYRRVLSIGRKVQTYCPYCRASHWMMAGKRKGAT